MINLGNKLKKLKYKFALRYLGLTTLFILGTQTMLGVVEVRERYKDKLANVTLKIRDTASTVRFFAKKEKFKLDDATLDTLLRETSFNQEHTSFSKSLLYVVVENHQGTPLSSFINQQNPTLNRVNEGGGSYNQSIEEYVVAIKQKSTVYEVRRQIFTAGKSSGTIVIGYTFDNLWGERIQESSAIMLEILGFTLILLGFILFVFQREVNTPLQLLLQWARSLDPDSSTPLPSHLKDDPIRQIKVKLQRVIQKLQRLQRQQNKTLAPQQLEQQTQEANLAKNEFLAMIGHEIRTPLNAVNGMTGLLLDTKLNSQQREFVNIIRGSGEILLTMINNILDFSKIEAQKLELEQQPFELAECIEEVLRLFVPQASEKKLELAYLIEPKTPTAIKGDVTRLRQILVNLIGNAVKFTEKGEVVVYVNATQLVNQAAPEVESSQYELRFAVKDTGIGIPEERKDRLFQSFSQVDPSTTRKYGGTGLGLAISKRLSEMMQGKMWVHSVEGKGSTFYFTIVAEAVPSLSPANARNTENQLVGKRLLIIDDNVTNQKILTHQAQSWGMYSIAVESGEKALEWFADGGTCDLAILDMNMPEMDGVTLAQEIRQKSHCKDLPLVMLSSIDRVSNGDEKVKRLFSAILTKPIQQSLLYDALVRIFTEKPIKIQKNLNQDNSRLAEELPLRILVAEDVSVNQEVIRLLLEKLGYWADIVSNGVEALRALHRQQYDVVLMDVRMPEMDGFTATRHIYQDFPGQSRPRIIAMTADAMKGDRERCLNEGMDDYLSKPIRLEDLRKALSRCNPLSDVSPVDPKSLDALRKLTGSRSPNVIGELIRSYLEDTPPRLIAIASAIAQGNPHDLRHAAHSLRSASLQLGAKHLSELCEELEKLGRSGTVAGASEVLNELEAEYQKVYEALQRELEPSLDFSG